MHYSKSLPIPNFFLYFPFIHAFLVCKHTALEFTLRNFLAVLTKNCQWEFRSMEIELLFLKIAYTLFVSLFCSLHLNLEYFLVNQYKFLLK